MTYKKILILSIVLFCNLHAFNQELGIGLQYGIGTYKMSYLKDYNSFIQENIIFETAITENFPPYYYYQVEIGIYIIKNFYIGLPFTFQSTGSRISHADYSGEYKFDTKISGRSLAIKTKYLFYIGPKLSMGTYLEFGKISSSLTINESIRIDTVFYDEISKDYIAKNIFIEPGIELNYHFSCIVAGITAGYSYDFQKIFYNKENNDEFYFPYSIKQIKSHWDGFRIGVNLFLNINQLYKSLFISNKNLPNKT